MRGVGAAIVEVEDEVEDEVEVEVKDEDDGDCAVVKFNNDRTS